MVEWGVRMHGECIRVYTSSVSAEMKRGLRQQGPRPRNGGVQGKSCATARGAFVAGRMSLTGERTTCALRGCRARASLQAHVPPSLHIFLGAAPSSVVAAGHTMFQMLRAPRASEDLPNSWRHSRDGRPDSSGEHAHHGHRSGPQHMTLDSVWPASGATSPIV